MISTAMAAPSSRPCVLLVDDEPLVLRALARCLRPLGLTLLTAENGEQALEHLANAPVDLVLTDSMMPGMDGAELLRQVQERYPHCLRMMLTGQADLGATIRAINEGHLYRYIAKPWHDDELRQVLEQALAHQQTERERLRLERLTLVQNRELADLNATLEERVEARTEELREVADMLDLAYAELKGSYVTATRVFSRLITLRLPRTLQTNAQVIDLLKAYAEAHGFDDEFTRHLTMAGALYNLGKLGWEDRQLTTPSEGLFASDREAYQRYPVTGETLLMALDTLDDTARIIRHHRERWNGSGYPDHLKGEEIPAGARLLALAVDFIELQRGMILPRRVSRDDALALLQRLAGRVYDPELCQTFVTLCIEQAPDLGLRGQDVLAVGTLGLEAGMVLARDLHSETGMLLLNEGKELTARLIERLMNFEAMEKTRFQLVVHRSQGGPA
ncbi:MAG: response regulator [Halomonas sp.]|uniref:HD domain-containing phosphohydrolase n=1 Tax=Halomonas sp. TaxID=1486246 RepID=UPI003970B5D3